jgi:hypothetical protein
MFNVSTPDVAVKLTPSWLFPRAEQSESTTPLLLT